MSNGEVLDTLINQDRGLKELRAKLERGAAQAAAGELIDGDEVFDELRELIEERRRAKQKSDRS
jgi:hypothetical protein